MGIICAAIFAYYIVLFARILLSWATMFRWRPPDGLAPVIKLVYDLTEPIMGFFRRYIPPIGGLDLSPIFIFILLGVVQRALGC